MAFTKFSPAFVCSLSFFAPLSAAAEGSVHTFAAPQEMTIEMITNLDGKSGEYPLMSLEEFCELNNLSAEKCDPKTVINVGEVISLCLGAGQCSGATGLVDDGGQGIEHVGTSSLTIDVNGIAIQVGSRSCLEGAACGGIGRRKPASHFTYIGASIEELNELNELIEIFPHTIILPNTLIRTK